MAVITAVKSGNWSDTTVWDLGRAPLDGDLVQAVTYIIDLDADVNQPNTVLNSTTGYYRYNDVGTRNVTANANLGTHTTVINIGQIRNATTGTLNFFGAVRGGVTGNAWGAYNVGTGTLNVTTATGGAGINAHGSVNNGTGTLNVTTAIGGAGAASYGAQNAAAGTLNVTTAIGGAGAASYGAQNAAAGTLLCDLAIGNDGGPGGSTANMVAGVSGSATSGCVTKVKRIQSGAYGVVAIANAVQLTADAANSAQFRTALGGATKTLVDSGAAADFPAVGNVRSGIVYNNGVYTGTAAIPTAAQVASGVPVDATVGTAVLTAAAILAAADSDPISANVTLWNDAVAPALLDLDTVLETPVTLGEALRVMLAALAGKTDGSGTPALTFLGQDGATVRIAATVDGIGNRTAVTVDGA